MGDRVETSYWVESLPLRVVGMRGYRHVRRGLGWANVMGLDAVAVAGVWQQAIGRAAGILPAPAERVALWVAVWLVYFLDRRMDAKRLRSDARATLRHRVHGRLGAAGGWALAVGLLVFAAAALRLDPSVVRWGVLVAAVAGVYLTVAQRWAGVLGFGVKEMVVGMVFAAGCGVHVFARGGAQLAVGPGVSVLMMGALFSMNCLMIGVWESEVDLGQALPGLSRRVGPVLRKGAMGLAVAGLAWGLFGRLEERAARAALGASVASAAVLLCAVDRVAQGRYTTMVRVAADVVLLTPVVCYAVL